MARLLDLHTEETLLPSPSLVRPNCTSCASSYAERDSRNVGTSLSVYGTISPGTASYNISIDGGLKTSQFEVTEGGWVDHTLFWTSETLEDSEHEVVFTVAEDAVNIDIPIIIMDYFVYETSSKTPMDSAVLFVDSQDVNVQYSGNWTEHPTNHYMMSATSRKSEAQGNSFTFTFEGAHFLSNLVYTKMI